MKKMPKSNARFYYKTEIDQLLEQGHNGQICLSEMFQYLSELCAMAEADAAMKAPHIVKKGESFLNQVRFELGWTNQIM